jgi:cytochrome c5
MYDAITFQRFAPGVPTQNAHHRRTPTVLAIAALVLWLSAGLSAESKNQQPAAAPAPASSSQYVGTTTCQGCHDELYKGFEKSPHWITTQETKTTHGAHGCE